MKSLVISWTIEIKDIFQFIISINQIVLKPVTIDLNKPDCVEASNDWSQ